MCERERINAYSDIAIVAKRRSQVIEHISERLAKILTPILEDGLLKMIDGCITGPKWPVPRIPWTKRKQNGRPKVSSRLLQ